MSSMCTCQPTLVSSIWLWYDLRTRFKSIVSSLNCTNTNCNHWWWRKQSLWHQSMIKSKNTAFSNINILRSACPRWFGTAFESKAVNWFMLLKRKIMCKFVVWQCCQKAREPWRNVVYALLYPARAMQPFLLLFQFFFLVQSFHLF